MAVSGVKLAVGTGSVSRASTVTQEAFSLTFDRPVLYRETEDGIVYVHSNGAALTSYTPGEATVDSALTQRMQLNPGAWTYGPGSQGIDARANGSYGAGKATALPVTPNSGDSVLLEKAVPLANGNVRNGSASAWAGFQFTSALPVAGRIAGPLGWYAGKTPTTYAIDLDAKVAALPRLALPAQRPPIADVLARLDCFWGMALLTNADASGSGYEAWIPQAVMSGVYPAGVNGNYGEQVSILIGAAGSHLIGDEATAAQKRSLLRRLVQIGGQIVEGGRATSNALGASGGIGGHYQWQWIPALCYLWARDLNDDLDKLRNLCPTSILAQSFYWTADRIAQLAPHSDPAKICISRRRTLSAVSGTQITYPVVNGPDPARFNPATLIMVRESDGATAVVSGVGDTATNGGSQVATIVAQPATPFAVGDVIYFRSPYAIVQGSADWRVTNDDFAINPSAVQDYRLQQSWLEEILFPHALGIWRSDWNAARDYVLRCMGQPNGYPAPWGTRSTYTYSGTAYQFDKAMWVLHAADYGLA